MTDSGYWLAREPPGKLVGPHLLMAARRSANDIPGVVLIGSSTTHGDSASISPSCFARHSMNKAIIAHKIAARVRAIAPFLRDGGLPIKYDIKKISHLHGDKYYSADGDNHPEHFQVPSLTIPAAATHRFWREQPIAGHWHYSG